MKISAILKTRPIIYASIGRVQFCRFTNQDKNLRNFVLNFAN